MTKQKKASSPTPYKPPRLIQFIKNGHSGHGACIPGSSDVGDCFDGIAPGYCSNGTIHNTGIDSYRGPEAPSMCWDGSSADSCSGGASGSI